MDPKSLSMIDLQVEENFPNIRGVLVVRNGYLVFENYYRGYGKSDHHHVWSVTKSITSILVGIAFKEGKIEDLHQELPRFFPRYFGPKTDPRKKEITLEHLLTMTSGFDPDGQYREDTRQLMLSENMVRASIEQPLASEPGERFAYNEGNPHLLSAILTKRTDENALGYAHEKLFGPLGIDSDPDAEVVWDPSEYERFEERGGFVWATDKQGNNTGGFGLKLTARDMAKLGYLYLKGGRWEDKQIVAKDYVEASRREQVESARGGYGYLWWTVDLEGHQAFYAAGYGGQRIYVVPDLDLVTVIVSHTPARPQDVPPPDTLVSYAADAAEDE